MFAFTKPQVVEEPVSHGLMAMPEDAEVLAYPDVIVNTSCVQIEVADYPPEYLRNIIWNRKLTKMKTQDSMCTLPPQSCL